MKKILIICIFAFVCLTGCNKNKFEVDVKDVNISLIIKRLEHDLLSQPTDSVEKELPALKEEYDDFFYFFSHFIGIGDPDSSDFTNLLRLFLTDFRVLQAYARVNELYPSGGAFEKELSEAFRHYAYYFPSDTLPVIYTFTSGFNTPCIVHTPARTMIHNFASGKSYYPPFTSGAFIGIGLDMYLGREFEMYPQLGLPTYRIEQMYPGKMICDVMEQYAQERFIYNDSADNLLNRMIYQGKIMYFLHAMLPQTHDTVLFGYTDLQWRWAEAYEDRIWEYMIEKKHLFANDQMVIKRYTEEAPFTSYFANNSAPRAGVYIGFKIVEGYMEHNPDTPLEALMNNDDYQGILNLSRYNP